MLGQKAHIPFSERKSKFSEMNFFIALYCFQNTPPNCRLSFGREISLSCTLAEVDLIYSGINFRLTLMSIEIQT